MIAPLPPPDLRRAHARRTAWLVAAAAFAVYAGFLLLGVVGQ